MRARMALAASGIGVELREIILRDKPAHMLALSAKGTVPVLWLDGGAVIDESREIMQWALAQNDPWGWLDRLDTARVDAFDDRFKHHLDRYKYASRYADEALTASGHRDICQDMLAEVESALSDDWLGGGQPGFTDIAILPFVRQFRIADSAWFDSQMELPKVQDWLMRFLDWPVFLAVMQKYDLWQPNNQGELFCPSFKSLETWRSLNAK
jgi:glutathione S-transferase